MLWQSGLQEATVFWQFDPLCYRTLTRMRKGKKNAACTRKLPSLVENNWFVGVSPNEQPVVPFTKLGFAFASNLGL